MPLVRIMLDAATPRQTRRAIADGVHEAMGRRSGFRFQIIDDQPTKALIFANGYLGVARRQVVFVQISLVRGRTTEQQQALYRHLADNLGTPAFAGRTCSSS